MAALRYLDPNYHSVDEDAYELFCEIKPGDAATNCVFQNYTVGAIHDIRHSRDEFTLGRQGFQILEHTSEHLPTGDEIRAANATLKLRPYLHETIQLAQKFFRTEHVYVADWRTRQNAQQPTNGRLYQPSKERHVPAPPFTKVHIDAAPKTAQHIVRDRLSEQEMAKFSQDGWRIRLVNIWRPLLNVRDAPLAFCDRRSVKLGDLVKVIKVESGKFEDDLQIRYYLLPSERHQWFWTSDQTPDELYIFVQWDSTVEGLSGVPHVAFNDPRQSNNPVGRESVEIQLIVIDRVSKV